MLMKSFGFILVMAALVACGPIEKKLGLEEDCLPEELIEDAIQIETGLHLDLTPDSVEK
jgi:hypothetical protein